MTTTGPPSDVPARWGRGRAPQADMEARWVVEIVDHLESRRVGVWLDGGWGIDALLGRQTRAHDDLDVLVRLEDVPRLERALAELGYSTVHGGAPCSFELVDAAGHQVDAHPIRFAPGGEARYRMDGGEDWVFPPGSLAGAGSVLGRSVRCMTPEWAMTCHATGYPLDAAHRADVAALAARFGIPIPEYRSAD